MTQPDELARRELARSIAELFGPVFARTTPDEWNELSHAGRIEYDEDGRAVRIKEGKS